MMNKLTLDGIEPAGRRVLVRGDFNVPLQDGEITDDSRIQACLPTITRLLDDGAKVVLMSHLGRPKGEANPALSLAPVAQRLAGLLKKEIHFVEDCVGKAPVEASEKLEPGQVLLLENLRFHEEEEANDAGFSRQLAELGDIYVNNAFGTAHRAHASTVGVTEYFEQAAAGLLMEAELTYLTQALRNAGKPYVAVLGGAKISGKMDVIKNLLGITDAILVGGGMVYTFQKVQGHEIGNSLLEVDREEMALQVLADAEKQGVDLVLPVDSVISTAADGSEPSRITEGKDIPSGYMGVDIGPVSREQFCSRLEQAQTIVWNGPMGIFEVPEFTRGTEEVAREVARATARGAVTIVGGGDSVAAIHRLGLTEEDFSHVSTGGGAFLEFLEGQELPGVAALTDGKQS
jgi:phosphoglycerate kinase